MIIIVIICYFEIQKVHPILTRSSYDVEEMNCSDVLCLAATWLHSNYCQLLETTPFLKPSCPGLKNTLTAFLSWI